MGMSAAQARLLYITSQLNNLSLQGQDVSNSKIRLSMDSEALQDKYTEALNNSQLYVTNNIFSATGTTKTNERITLANLAEQDLLVYNGSKILGYSYQEVDTGETKKVLIGYEKDYSKPIYAKKQETSTFRSASTSADVIGSEDLTTMKSTVNGIQETYGLTDDDISVVSYTSNINGAEKTINSISINSENGLVAALNTLFTDPAARKQNYVLNFPEGTVIDFSPVFRNFKAYLMATVQQLQILQEHKAYSRIFTGQ